MPEILYFEKDHPRLTVQEALAALDRRELKIASRGRIDVSGFRLASGEVIWCAAPVFEIEAYGLVSVPLLAARRCSARFDGRSISLGVDELHGAQVDETAYSHLRMAA